MLEKAISLYQERLVFSSRYEQKQKVWQKIQTIPINQTRNNGKIVYKSAIALKLASILQQPPISIATELAHECRQIVNTKKIQLEVISSGIILFQITDLSIAHWLNHISCANFSMNQKNLQTSINFKSIEPTTLFQIQYSHARCCSLLRMGKRDHLITLTATDRDTYDQLWFIQSPKPIPWQKSNGELQFFHHAEYQLITEITSTLDHIYCVSATKKPINWGKVANALSQAFQVFYSQCRIWGEVKLETPKLAQARLGLVLVTQSVLRFLLEKKLGEEAPIEL